MIEKVYNYSTEDGKNIEKLVNDDTAQINHMVLPKGEGLPVHHANSHVYMIIVRGQMSIKLDEQEFHQHSKGEIINIPYNTLMDVQNKDEEVLEFFVVKAPNPKFFEEA